MDTFLPGNADCHASTAWKVILTKCRRCKGRWCLYHARCLRHDRQALILCHDKGTFYPAPMLNKITIFGIKLTVDVLEILMFVDPA